MKLTVLPASPERWPDVEAVFGARGCSQARGCFCMYYRRSGATLNKGNRARLKALVDAGRTPGLIGYRDGVPVGWVSIAPREEYERLARSPVLKPVDAELVWSIICFVVPKAYRGQGVARALLEGAIAHAARRGAKLLEAYPVDRPDRTRDENMWFGTPSMFERAGFREVARRKPQRPIVRLDLKRR